MIELVVGLWLEYLTTVVNVIFIVIMTVAITSSAIYGFYANYDRSNPASLLKPWVFFLCLLGSVTSAAVAAIIVGVFHILVLFSLCVAIGFMTFYLKFMILFMAIEQVIK